MKSKMKRRMLAIVLCMVIVLSNSSFIFASSESGTPAVEAASTEGTTSQTGLSSFLCKFFRKNFMGRGTSPFVELVALKLHLIKVPT